MSPGRRQQTEDVVSDGKRGAPLRATAHILVSAFTEKDGKRCDVSHAIRWITFEEYAPVDGLASLSVQSPQTKS